jgi:hypothetical protein
MIKFLDLIVEHMTDWEFGYDRPFKFDPNSTTNEGRFRMFPPDDIKKDSYFRTKTHPWTKEVIDGISYVMGKRIDNDRLKIQAIRFNKNIWNEEQAKEWFDENRRKFYFYRGELDEGLNLQKKQWYDKTTQIRYFENLLENYPLNEEWRDLTNAIIERLHKNFKHTHSGKTFYLIDEVGKILDTHNQYPIDVLNSIYDPAGNARFIIESGETSM